MKKINLGYISTLRDSKFLVCHKVLTTSFLAAAFFMSGFLFLGNVAQAATWTVNANSTSTNACESNTCPTIQDAVTAASAGDTVSVAAGTYTENITIDKAITLQGENGADLVGSITVTTPSGDATTTISGMDITNTTSSFGIYADNVSHLAITDNTIHGIGSDNSYASGSAQAIDLHATAAVSDILVSGNHISDVGNAGLMKGSGNSGSAKGIYLGDSASTQDFSDVIISNNDITNVQANGTSAYADGGRGAYGILVNHGTTGLQITNNTIKTLDGLWAHAVGLEGDTASTTVTGNKISGLTDHKTPSDAVAFQFESNPDAGSVTLTGNTIDPATVSWMVQNMNVGQVVDASQNTGITMDKVTGTGGVKVTVAGTPAANTLYVVAQGDVPSDTSGNSVCANTADYCFGVNVFPTIQDAINAAKDGDTIMLSGDINVTAQINVNTPVTINGNGHTITATADFGTSNSTKHLADVTTGTVDSPVTFSDVKLDSNNNAFGLNTYSNAYLALNGVTLENSKGAGLTVNGSTVVADNLDASGNSWGSVNVDPGDTTSGVPSIFTFNSGTLSDATQIWSDGDNVTTSTIVTVTAPAGYTKYKVGGTNAGYVWTNQPLTNGVVATVDGIPTTFSTIQGAVDAVADGGTVTFAQDFSLSSPINLNHAVVLDGAGHTITPTYSKTGTSDNAAIEIAADNVTIKNLIEDGTSGTDLHGINIYRSTGVNLDGVTVSNNGHDGVVVNGSEVTVNNITTSNNGWGGIDVDLGINVTSTAVLTVNGVSAHDEPVAAIVVDDNTKDVTVNDVNSQYASETYTHDNNVVGTVYELKHRTVSTTAGLTAALADPLVSDITLDADITLSSQLNVNRAVTIDGGNHTLTTTADGDSVIDITADNVTIKNLVEDGIGTSNNRGINIYVVTGVTLDNVTAENNAKNGIVVNGSTVTVNNITTKNNGWEGIDVDQGKNVTTLASLTVNGTSVHEEAKAAIRIDDTSKVPTPTVIDTNNQYAAVVDGVTTDYVLKNVVVGNETELATALGNSLVNKITVLAGDYNIGNITINRSLQLLGPNADVNPNTGTRGAEATLTGTIVDYAGNTDIKGFTITDPSYGGSTIEGVHIYSAGPVISDINVENNIFSNIANSQTHGSYGVMVQGAVDNVSISNNKIDGVTSAGWAHAIEVTPTCNSLTVPQNVTVDGNSISNVVGDNGDSYGFTADWCDAAKPPVANTDPIYADASQITFRNNSLVGVNVRNLDSATSTLDASNNWWGTASSTSTKIASRVSAGVNYEPWYINPLMTVLSSDVSNSGIITVANGGDLGFTATTTGQAELPDGTSGVALNNGSVLNLSGNTNTASGGNVTVGGSSVALNGGVVSGVNLTTPQTVGGQSVTIDKAVKLNSGSSTQPIVITNTSVSNASVSISDGTTILAPSGWTGTIQPPTADSGSGTAPSGFSVGSTIISVGSPDAVLLFDKAVKITLTGVTGSIGYKPAGSDTWTQITTECNSATDHSNISFPNECYFTSGSDTIIWTYHFTTFGGLDPIPAPTPASSGGGGGGGGGNSGIPWNWNPYASPVVTQPTAVAQPTGQVLGATAFDFTFNLNAGMSGSAVTELQNRLTAEGVYSGPITGYFGPLTLAAVKAYQTKKGITPASGFVGPLTRAQLNNSLVLGASTVNTAAIKAEIVSLQAQLVVLLQQMVQILQAQAK